MSGKREILIVDGSSVLYRAFHAIPRLTSSSGLPTNAVYGFAQTLRKILKDRKPRFIAVAFDVKGGTFRHEIYEDYKAERPPMPDDLSLQIPYIKRLLHAYGIAVIEKEGYEADDVIATLAKKLKGFRFLVVTGDKDMYQLVDEHTVILDYVKNKEYGEREVADRFGVPPGAIADLIALAGDPSDNIPGVPGVGLKTAAKLIKRFGSIEELYKRIDEVTGEKLREKLLEHRESAELSKRLATLKSNVPIKLEPEDLRYTGPDYDELARVLRELEFSKLLKEISREMGRTSIHHRGSFRLIGPGDLDVLTEELKSIDRIALTADVRGEGFGAKLRGLALCTGHDAAFYIHLDGEDGGKGGKGGKGGEDRTLEKVLSKKSLAKATDDAKTLFIVLKKTGIPLKGLVMDTSLASYLLNPSRQDHGIGELSFEHLGKLFTDEPPEGEDVQSRYRYFCKKACIINELTDILDKKLKSGGLYSLLEEMELPLAEVLADMEIVGIKVDREKLEDFSKELERELSLIEKTVYDAAGYRFNLSSPKQLSELLFNRLGLKPVKRTKTGYSTDEEVLRTLAAQHEIPQHILSYRQLSKLKSTYVDAIAALIDPSTGRVHTSFNQTVTATGRLSSSKPNLQNIPIRGGLASRIRSAFVAEEGYLFLSADYSQIELRLVAHLSEDPTLIAAFERGDDIHTITASEVFGIPPSKVTPEMRRRAKAINFGIIYGMGAYGLSVELGIPVDEARSYIESYFEHYGSVKDFIDRTIEEAGSRGYTTTLFGRRRYIPELSSSNEQTRRLGERMAVNTPIQGSAADMIKASMVAIYRELKTQGSGTRMILQIHDELIFEVPEGELNSISGLVKDRMEGVIELRVPVVVNIKSGRNWAEVG